MYKAVIKADVRHDGDGSVYGGLVLKRLRLQGNVGISKPYVANNLHEHIGSPLSKGL
jgi:hypothetical protein